ncbi:hypothetical protein [Bradyrhizobium sp. F1.13.3]|uniref:hypothetical protein n=1 Tax=Bradyrhizobium sp. F1.13.3 TaxID=3156351 RepID=UPI0033916BDF
MTEHTPFPNFGKVECFCGGRLTAFQVFCPTGDERPSPEASAPQFEQGLAPEEWPRITLALGHRLPASGFAALHHRPCPTKNTRRFPAGCSLMCFDRSYQLR